MLALPFQTMYQNSENTISNNADRVNTIILKLRIKSSYPTKLIPKVYRQSRTNCLCLTIINPELLFSCEDLALESRIQTHLLIFHYRETNYSLSSTTLIKMKVVYHGCIIIIFETLSFVFETCLNTNICVMELSSHAVFV